MDKQRRQKFDAISDGHEAALISMGIISESQRITHTDEQKCPSIFLSLFAKYRELKFVQKETSDNITIYPREMLKWSDLVAYKDITGQEISAFEAELIMGIDAVFESREDQI